jgi:hypothetical protein
MGGRSLSFPVRRLQVFWRIGYPHHERGCADVEHKCAHDQKSHIGKFDGSDEAAKRGWVVASMKDDWKTVFPAKK